MIYEINVFGKLSELKKTEKEIEKLNKKKDSFMSAFLDALSARGVEIANAGFASANYNGHNDVVVDRQMTNEGYVIRAYGQSVLFIEFGTGVYAYHPLGSKYGYVPGSWSKDHEKLFSTYGFWYYNGEKMVGEKPAMVMYDLCKQLADEAPTIAERVWKQIDRH